MIAKYIYSFLIIFILSTNAIAHPGITEGSRKIAQGFKEIILSTGKALKESGRAIGKGFKHAGKETGKAFKQMGKEIKQSFSEKTKH